LGHAHNTPINEAATTASAGNFLRKGWLLLGFFMFCEFLFLVLAFFDLSSLRIHFRPFIDVLRKILESLTQKAGFAALNR
jgi:hypothetical protein